MLTGMRDREKLVLELHHRVLAAAAVAASGCHVTSSIHPVHPEAELADARPSPGMTTVGWDAGEPTRGARKVKLGCSRQRFLLGTDSIPSPLVGEGYEGLVSESELSRSWVRGSAPQARSAQALKGRASDQAL